MVCNLIMQFYSLNQMLAHSDISPAVIICKLCFTPIHRLLGQRSANMVKPGYLHFQVIPFFYILSGVELGVGAT